MTAPYRLIGADDSGTWEYQYRPILGVLAAA